MKWHESQTKLTFRLVLILTLALCCGRSLAAQDEEVEEEKPIREAVQFRIDGPKTLNHGENLVIVRAQYEGSKRWRIAKPEEFEVTISGAAELATDISHQPVNPVTLVATTDGECSLSVSATVGTATLQKTFSIEQVEATQTVSVVVDPEQASHFLTNRTSLTIKTAATFHRFAN